MLYPITSINSRIIVRSEYLPRVIIVQCVLARTRIAAHSIFQNPDKLVFQVSSFASFKHTILKLVSYNRPNTTTSIKSALLMRFCELPIHVYKTDRFGTNVRIHEQNGSRMLSTTARSL